MKILILFRFFQPRTAQRTTSGNRGEFYSGLFNHITILFHITQTMHIMHYLFTKEEDQMAFGVDGATCGCGTGHGVGAGIAIVVVIILLLIAMGIVF